MLPAAVYNANAKASSGSGSASGSPKRSRRRAMAPGGLRLGSSSFDAAAGRGGGVGRSGWMKVEG